MDPFTEILRRFGSDDAGAITVSWVSLSSAILLGGLVVIYSIYGNGVSALATEVNSISTTAFAFDIGLPPAINGGG
ncbi:MAG: hypothetical protein ACE5EU_08970 [Paracoccaceae bacterium]